MKAVTARRYGGPDVVAVETLPLPEPKPGQILIRVEAAAVNASDWRIRSLDVPSGLGVFVRMLMGWSRLRNPVLGSDAAGVVEAVGEDVTRSKPGDRVAVCSEALRGGHAQFMIVPEEAPVVPIPDGVSMDEAAAAIFGGTTALFFLEKAAARAGQSILVIGASGTVGGALTQLATHMGLNVTALCSAANAELVQEMGAREVIDYHQTPATSLTGQFDLVADCVGADPMAALTPLVAPGGAFLLVSARSAWDMIRASMSPGKGIRAVAGSADANQDRVAQVIGWVDDGVWRPRIDSVYPLERARAAHERVDSRRKVGSVLLHPWA